MNWRNVPKIGCRLLLGILMIRAGLGCGGGDNCSDKERNGTETDIDCGGSCGKCELGLVCASERDCLSGACGGNGRCVPSGCTNQAQDGNETGIDCGVECPQCPGDGCTENQQCAAGWCNLGNCDQPGCGDQVTNGRETGTDCGGPVCPPCPTGQPCLVVADCLSKRCGNGVCNAPPRSTADACAVYNACVDIHTRITGCVLLVHLFSQLPGYEQSRISMEDFRGVLSLMQNKKCVAEAGADCEKALACLNQGEAVRGCVEGNQCLDSSNLVNCLGSETETGWQFVEMTLRCNLLGLQCVDLGGLAKFHYACAYQESKVVSGVEVSCAGTVAKVHSSNLSYSTDCNQQGAVCRPGSYTEIEPFSICEGTGPACDEASFQERCAGNQLVSCVGGKEAVADCPSPEMICQTAPSGEGRCTYAVCDPSSYNERCDIGTISYCAPQGESTLSCADLGFAACTTDGYSARCTN